MSKLLEHPIIESFLKLRVWLPQLCTLHPLSLLLCFPLSPLYPLSPPLRALERHLAWRVEFFWFGQRPRTDETPIKSTGIHPVCLSTPAPWSLETQSGHCGPALQRDISVSPPMISQSCVFKLIILMCSSSQEVQDEEHWGSVWAVIRMMGQAEMGLYGFYCWKSVSACHNPAHVWKKQHECFMSDEPKPVNGC